MDDGRLALLLPVGLGLLFLGLWAGMFQVLARVGGWRELARAYPPLGIVASAGERFRMRSARLRRGVNYNRCITFVADPAALQLSMPRILGFGHPPIEVPWSEISSEASRSLWMPLVTLRCARAPSVPVQLGRGLAESLARASGGQLRLPSAGEAR